LRNDRVVVENEEKGAVLPQKAKSPIYVKSGRNKMRQSEFC
jgi:hypothetical protein